MKNLTIILSVFFALSVNLHAEEYPSFIFSSDKTTEDSMIEAYYKQYELIPQIEKKCDKTMKWAKGHFNLFDSLYTHTKMCLIWETNKKLNKEQIKLLTKLHKTWENVIMDFIQGDNFRDSFSQSFGDMQEYSLQLTVRLYNIIMNQKWPECLYETGKNTENLYNKPCNKISKIMKNCNKKQNPLLCMKHQIVNKVSEMKVKNNRWHTEAELKEKRLNDLNSLLALTEKFINNEKLPKEEIIRLYNFYWLSIIRTYQDTLKYINKE